MSAHDEPGDGARSADDAHCDHDHAHPHDHHDHDHAHHDHDHAHPHDHAHHDHDHAHHDHDHAHHDHDHAHPHDHDHAHHDHAHPHDHAHHDHAHHDHGPVLPPLARAEGVGRIVFLDAFSGVAGDMLLASLLDLGVPPQPIVEALGALPVTGYRFGVRSTSRSGIRALRVLVDLETEQPSRNWRDIREMLRGAKELRDGVCDRALRVFARLADAEGRVHGMSPENVHFHEVGAIDAIVDIVATCAALDYLGAELVVSPLPMGRGFVRAAHGTLPLPPPAVVECLRDVPTYDAGIDAELVTPTGAALVAALATRFTRWPNVRPLRTGWGAGTRELADRPNLLRAILAEPEPLAARDATPLAKDGATHVVIEANVDDMTPEVAAWAVERTLAAGALDVWTTPVGMKKGRPALVIAALCPLDGESAVTAALLRETSSLGVRVTTTRRHERPRRMLHVETPWGTVHVKVADGDGLPPNVAPEHDDCAHIARAHDVPLKSVYAAALSGALRVLEPQRS